MTARDVFEVLADPIRMEIVDLLTRRERAAGEIAARFDVSGPAISRHLRVLREAGLATYRRDGQRRLYRLDPGPLQHAEEWIARHRREWERRFEALERRLDEMEQVERRRRE